MTKRMTVAFTCERVDANAYRLERMLEHAGFRAPVVTLWADGEHGTRLTDGDAS